MRRFGFSVVIIILIIFVPLIGACDEIQYDEKEMGKLATLVRTVMDIVSSEYIECSVPKELSEEQIVEAIKRINTDFEELNILDTYEIVMVSDEVHLAAVVWDPQNERKLIQDLRCTTKLDEPTWLDIVYGHEFTLGWSLCSE